MKIDFDYKTLMIKYLLKELPEIESIEFEEQYFENQDLFEQLLIVEDELIDDYLRGVLPKETKDKFERYFLATPKRQQRVEFAKILMEKFDSKDTTKTKAEIEEKKNFWQDFWQSFYSKTFILRWSFITIGFMLAIGFLWFYIQKENLLSKELEKKQIKPIVIEQYKNLKEKDTEKQPKEQPLNREESNFTAKEKAKDKPNEKALTTEKTQANLQVALLTLYPSVRSTGVSEVLKIPSSEALANIKLVIDPKLDYQKYFVSLVKLEKENKEIWQQTINVANRKNTNLFLSVKIPTKLLTPADYEFIIFSLPDKDEYQQSYNFSVKE